MWLSRRWSLVRRTEIDNEQSLVTARRYLRHTIVSLTAIVRRSWVEHILFGCCMAGYSYFEFYAVNYSLIKVFRLKNHDVQLVDSQELY